MSWCPNPLPTDRTYTGQEQDGTGLMFYHARFYDPYLNQWIQPDTIVPDAGIVADYNRYSYVRNNPLKYSDPSGHDPLDSDWEQAFYQQYGRNPTDQDRRDRLFSLMFLGSGSDGSWTTADWDDYLINRDAYWKGTRNWSGDMAPGLERFAVHVERLAAQYKPNETGQFVKAFAFVFGGIPLGNPIISALDMIKPGDDWDLYWPLEEGKAGWIPDLVDDDNPSHHYAGLFYVGYWFGSGTGKTVNWLRDGPLSEYDAQDIRLGNGGAQQGWDLRVGQYSIDNLGRTLRLSLSIQPYIVPQGQYPY